MKLKDYLTEADMGSETYKEQGRAVVVPSDKALKMMTTTYWEAFEEYVIERTQPMLRGSNHSEQFLFMEPSKFDRKSGYQYNNIYNMLLSNLDSWKGFPKRNKSIIGVTDINVAESYGDGLVYMMLFKKGTKIAVCPADDIFHPFKRELGAGSLGWLADDIFQAAHHNGNKLPNFPTWDELQKALERITDEWFKHPTSEYSKGAERFDSTLGHFLVNNCREDSLEEALNKVLDPHKKGFKMVTMGQLIPEGNEVWSEGDCLLIDYQMILDYKKWKTLVEIVQSMRKYK